MLDKSHKPKWTSFEEATPADWAAVIAYEEDYNAALPDRILDAIRSLDYRTDEGVGVDIGMLWVAENYQLGAQVTNINQPTFNFPDVNLDPYSSELIIGFLEADQRYVMDRQLKLEAPPHVPDPLLLNNAPQCDPEPPG